jgi:hypothetical protein
MFILWLYPGFLDSGTPIAGIIVLVAPIRWLNATLLDQAER